MNSGSVIALDDRDPPVATAALLAIADTRCGSRISSGSIAGTVTDESAAVLPGVTVTATSSALQVPQLVTVTDSAGFIGSPIFRLASTASVTSSSGFQTLRRDDLQLSVGFAARVDVSLKVGALEETRDCHRRRVRSSTSRPRVEDRLFPLTSSTRKSPSRTPTPTSSG